jgi:hypothetical protein
MSYFERNINICKDIINGNKIRNLTKKYNLSEGTINAIYSSYKYLIEENLDCSKITELGKLLDDNNDRILNALCRNGINSIESLVNLYKKDPSLKVLLNRRGFSIKTTNFIIDKIKGSIKIENQNELDFISFIRKIEDNKILDNLAGIYPDFPFHCYNFSVLIYKIIEDNIINLNDKDNIHLVHGYYNNINDILIDHYWIEYYYNIIDVSLIQFILPFKDEFKGYSNFKEYFKSNGGVTKSIKNIIGGILIDKKSDFYKNYNKIDYINI